jgi:hypothetical protein
MNTKMTRNACERARVCTKDRDETKKLSRISGKKILKDLSWIKIRS